MYTAGQVARVLGIAETTLRSWHRRYGVGPDAATPGAYRRYTVDDVARLQTMCDLIRAGMLASDAARTLTGPPGDGHVHLVRDRLAAAGRRLDSHACRAAVEDAIRAHGVETAWEHVCGPVLRDVDTEQTTRAGDPVCVAVEHVLSWAITAALHQVTGAAGDRPSVMLACTDTEQHTLPLEVLAAALTERHVPVRMLGASVPAEGLVGAVRVAAPHVVVLWSHSPATASRDTVSRLRRVPVRVLTAGPGWPRRRDSADHADTLAGALASLAAVTPSSTPGVDPSATG